MKADIHGIREAIINAIAEKNPTIGEAEQALEEAKLLLKQARLREISTNQDHGGLHHNGSVSIVGDI